MTIVSVEQRCLLRFENLKVQLVSFLSVLLFFTGIVSATTTKSRHRSSFAKASRTSVSAVKASHTATSRKTASRRATAKRSAARRTSRASVTSVAFRPRGQRTIEEDRTREIQEALIREHYLEGEPTGVWNAETKEALTHYQAENGWQTKVVPDSRALIKLGLGPDKSRLLNPETAMTPSPHELGVENEVQPGGAIQQ